MYIINNNSRYRIGKNFLHTLSFRFHWEIYIKSWIWAFCDVIYTVNHMTKHLDRSWGAHNQHLCSSVECWSLAKYFDGLPNSFLEHFLLPWEGQRGGHIQSVAWQLKMIPHHHCWCSCYYNMFLESHSKRSERNQTAWSAWLTTLPCKTPNVKPH